MSAGLTQFDQIWCRNKKNPTNIGIFGNVCQFPISCSERNVTKCIYALTCPTQCCDRPGSSFQSHVWVFVAV